MNETEYLIKIMDILPIGYALRKSTTLGFSIIKCTYNGWEHFVTSQENYEKLYKELIKKLD